MARKLNAYRPIEDYGIIGDLRTVALVGKNGAIDFMCFPEFDSPTIFAALLDAKKGGEFRVGPVLDSIQSRQMYLPETNVLLTRFHSKDGLSELSDFMPIERDESCHHLMRRIKAVRGELPLEMTCRPRFDYARMKHEVARRDEREVVFVPAVPSPSIRSLRLRSGVPLEIENGDVVARFRLRPGEHAWFVLDELPGNGEGHLSLEDQDRQVSRQFKETLNYWRGWIGKSQYRGRWSDEVRRSALVLKLLTSQRYGSIVAAPTFGLPEVLGGERNWDYRYSWIRDSAFTVYAFMRLGLTEETERYMSFIEARYAELEPDGSIQVMYGIDGRHRLEERELGHLEGYRGSSPVRIGNDAYRQRQLDIYGELMDSVYLFDKYGYPISHGWWSQVQRMVEWVCRNWQTKDRSIWEIRGEEREFLVSRVMCWVALDRAIRLAQKRSFPAPLHEWTRERDAIYREVFGEFWSRERSAFVQYKGSTRMDASHLLMPLVRFISPRDPQWLTTLEAVREELVSDALVQRYDDSHTEWDGLRGTEGTFSMCSFWLVEAIARSGDIHQARLLFEKMLGYANHLGLYSEQLGPCGEHLGNYPQAFTHLALISAAFDLDRRFDQAQKD